MLIFDEPERIFNPVAMRGGIEGCNGGGYERRSCGVFILRGNCSVFGCLPQTSALRAHPTSRGVRREQCSLPRTLGVLITPFCAKQIKKAPLGRFLFGGEGGIRTPDTGEPVCRISNPVHSTTLPPLRVVSLGYCCCSQNSEGAILHVVCRSPNPNLTA